MQLPVQISFRHMDHTEEIKNLVQEKAAALDQFASEITSCRIVIEPAGKHHLHGNLYEVRIDLTVPGEEIAVTRTPSEHMEHRRLEIALRDAFDTARRKLEDYVRRRRGAVKGHESQPRGRIDQIFPREGYGFIVTREGREIYFHRNSVSHEGFERLQPGMEVSFVEEEGEKGPQASVVKLVGGAHHA